MQLSYPSLIWLGHTTVFIVLMLQNVSRNTKMLLDPSYNCKKLIEHVELLFVKT